MEGVDLDLVTGRVAHVLQRNWTEATVKGLRPLEGGHSGLTLVADVVEAPIARVVVKMAPPGRAPVGRHDVIRQARLLDAIHDAPGVAVPAIHGTDPGDGDGVPPLVVMAWVAGETVEPILDAPDIVRDPAMVARRARAAARMLAHLHAVDPAAAAPAEAVTDWRDERERWVPTMATVDETLRRRAPQLLELLRATSPKSVAPALLHGDYRLGNLLCDGDEVRGIIDWEIWSVGDPRVDLGWFLVFTDPHHLPGASAPAEGMPDAAALEEEYSAARGAPLPDMAWFHALARYKMAAIMGNNLQRHREGRYHDPYQERLPDSIRSLIDQGIELLSR